MNKTQACWATGIALITLLLGATLLDNASLFLRLLMGLALGFALTKGSLGFAGSVNRAYRRGSTQLLQTLMLMFVVTAVINAGLLFNADSGDYRLWVNPINMGLLIGGVMFGAGMSLSSCCATGVMVEMVGDIPRALTTLFFFGAGVFFGFPLQATQGWIRQTVMSTKSYEGKGVFLPDLFSWGPLHGYFFAVLVTIAFALIVVMAAKKYQQRREDIGTYYGVDGEMMREQVSRKTQPQSAVLWSQQNYLRWFGNVWQMSTSALVIALIFGVMMVATGSGWGASTPFGVWFGKLLMAFGVSSANIAAFTHRPEALFNLPFFSHSVSVQNLAIMIGTLVAVLYLGKFSLSLKNNYTIRHYALFALGGLLMGFGTRFANGCNVGALFTPIANFSLSGWVFLIVLLLGGVLGNKLQASVLKQC
ncbi:YeeE/YedE family protein [Vibrio sp. CAIM 722]|uniref:YeeE/YedE family protein n=1 Tax=Vibrio eleionomae TaxID=2653505 RepID=A0A7X4LM43_9VIBR|nr:YeeE/YedE family protein [Vibrio eleionomae]MZI94414.1 YeeE/YedE family protein [Vibrio eleionomae]